MDYLLQTRDTLSGDLKVYDGLDSAFFNIPVSNSFFDFLSKEQNYLSPNLKDISPTFKATVPITPPDQLSFIPVVPSEKLPFSGDRFIALQKWEGYVNERDGDKLFVFLNDLSNGGEQEEAVFSLLDDINPEDRALAVPGAIFYWSIGHETKRGIRQKASLIRFKRIPLMDADERIDNRNKGLDLKRKANLQ